jgi:Circularly permutated YpsA SLOG family
MLSEHEVSAMDRQLLTGICRTRAADRLPQRDDCVTVTIVHGGQTGVDRGAHEAAIDNGWPIAGYMPQDGRDERGKIPDAIARHLIPCARAGYGARTEVNVRMADAALIVVRNAEDPLATPGTTKTIALAADRRLPRMIVDPEWDPAVIARWIWRDLLTMTKTLSLPLLGAQPEPTPTRLLVAGPRESLWQGAQVETTGLLRGVAQALAEITQGVVPKGDSALDPR